LRLGVSDPNVHSLNTHLPGGYAETTKWFFTLLTSQAGTGYTSLVFPNQMYGILHWVKIFAT